MAAEGPGPTAPTSSVPRHPAPVTDAQKLAGLVGLVLLAAGALGFLANGDFGTGASLRGDTFIGFEVNGWSNVAHIAVGLMLLAAVPSRSATRAAWRIVALSYLIAFVAGLISGDDIFGVFPVNTADHVLDGVLFAIGFAGARRAKEDRGTLERDRVIVPEAEGPMVVGPGSGHVGGRRRNVARIDARL
jgi:hypothetical protein